MQAVLRHSNGGTRGGKPGAHCLQYRLIGVEVKAARGAVGLPWRVSADIYSQVTQRTREVAARIRRKPLQRSPSVGDDIAVVIQTEFPSAGIKSIATVTEHEKAFTVNGQIKIAVGKVAIALAKLLANRL